jgi:hypothetical protein
LCDVFFLNEEATGSLYVENDRCFGLEGEKSCKKIKIKRWATVGKGLIF